MLTHHKSIVTLDINLKTLHIEALNIEDFNIVRMLNKSDIGSRLVVLEMTNVRKHEERFFAISKAANRHETISLLRQFPI